MKYVVIILVVLLVISVAVAAYFAGKSQTIPVAEKATSVVSYQTSSPNNPTPVSSASATSSPKQTRTLSFGGKLVFKAYTIEIPSLWQDSKENPTVDSEKIILTKGSYSITISQVPAGGGNCIFPGDPTVEGPSSIFTSFSNLIVSGIQFRRAQNTSGQTGFSFCEKTQNGWFMPTSIGFINYISPQSHDAATVQEMDSIISSAKIK